MTGRLGFYARWVWANAWSELVGLGLTLLLVFLFFGGVDEPGPAVVIGGAAFAVVAGAFLEGAIVGYAQGAVLARRLSALRLSRWIWATIIGAGIAWLLGMIPSTVVAFTVGEHATVSSMGGPEGVVVLALAAGMGLVLGSVFGTPQYFVLRKHVSRAGRWIVANAVAWMAGMVAVFAAAGTIQASSGIHIGITVALGCLGAGAMVGLVHGLVLVRLLDRNGAFSSS